MEDKLIEKVEQRIEEILQEEINPNNIEHLYKLAKIRHMTKEDKCMNYGNYGNYGRPGYNSYGDNYGRRGYDMKYRGDESLDRLYGEYGRYHDAYGHDRDKSFHYMISSLEDFIKVLYEEAESQQQKQMLRDTLQRSIM